MSEPGPAAQVPGEAAVEASFARACGIADPEVRAGRDGAGTLVVDVPPGAWVQAATHARDELKMDFLDWLSAVDAPDGDPPGLDVVLHVAATGSAGERGEQARLVRRDSGAPYVQRLLLRTRVPDAGDGMPAVPSLTALWPGVAWHERETFEMFGVQFTGFDDGSGQPIRPLLLPEGFEGTPLRKSFVLAARAAKAWPGAKDPADSSGPGSAPAGAGSAGGRGGKSPSRRKTLPPGVPDPAWGPRELAPGESADGG